MDLREKVLSYLRMHGPSVPTETGKYIGKDSVIASAFLSELKANGKVKISSLKVGGGSPLYYLPGQENLLDNFIDNLDDKEQKVYHILKEKQVVRDADLIPVFRAAMRAIKDFAVQITVNLNGKQELFWKWHLLQNSEVEEILRNIYAPKKQSKPQPTPQSVQENKIVTQKTEPVQKKEESVNSEPIEQKLEEKNSELSTEQVLSERKKQESLTLEKKEIKKEKQSLLKSTQQEKQTEKKEEKTPEKISEKNIQKEKPKKKDSVSSFYDEVISYFNEKGITVVEEMNVKKSEAEFIVNVPSPVGEMACFVKAKNKKKLNEGDLSTVFVQAQSKHLPALFISKGELNKKAQDMLNNEFKGLKFTKI